MRKVCAAGAGTQLFAKHDKQLEKALDCFLHLMLHTEVASSEAGLNFVHTIREIREGFARERITGLYSIID